MTLARELITHIKTHGPLTVADYMARCNAHYYATRDPFGVQGDFTTAPEISQIFGELVGAWLAECWQQSGKPRAVLCELGPGRGTLMKDALRATRGVKGFHEAIDIRLIETSPHLRNLQKQALKGAHPRMEWEEELRLPALPLLLIANEMFDALPIEQYVRVNLQENPRHVDHDGKAFVWLPEGKVIREASPASATLMTEITEHLHRSGGAALIIDYGYSGGAQADTLQAVQRHHPVDPLEAPGEADLTAHVDFGALAHTAQSRNTVVHGPVEQGAFLKRLGAELRATALCRKATPKQREAILSGLERIVAPHQMGRLFKVMAVTSSVDTPAGF